MPSTQPEPTEWPRLDLAKRNVIRLALAWSIPYSPEAASLFAGLLDARGSFTNVLSYRRGGVLHYRIEAARIGPTEDAPLMASVQYDTGAVVEIPRFLQDRAWLPDRLQGLESDLPITVHAEIEYPASPELETAVALPYPPASDARYAPFDEIVGVRGVKHPIAGLEYYGYEFTLDRYDDGDVGLSLDFSLPGGTVAKAPDDALHNALFFARRLVHERRKPRKEGTS